MHLQRESALWPLTASLDGQDFDDQRLTIDMNWLAFRRKSRQSPSISLPGTDGLVAVLAQSQSVAFLTSDSSGGPFMVHGLPLRHPRVFAADSSGNLWIGGDHGVIRHRPGRPASEAGQPFTNRDAADTPGSGVQSLLPYDSSHAWVGTRGMGLCHLDTSAREVWSCTQDKLPGRRVHSLAPARRRIREGQPEAVWVGTDRGLIQAYLDPESDSSIVVSPLPTPLEGEHPGSPIEQMVEDSHGVLWMATRGEGLVSWNPDELVVKQWGGAAGLERARGIVPVADDQETGVHLAGVAVGPDDRIFVKQGGVVYDYRDYPGRPWWAYPLLLVSMVALAGLLVAGGRRFRISHHPVVKTLKEQGDLSSLPLPMLPETVPAALRVIPDLAAAQQLSPERWRQILSLAAALAAEDSQALSSCFLALTRLTTVDHALPPGRDSFLLQAVTLAGTGLAVPGDSRTLMLTLRDPSQAPSGPDLLSAQLADALKQSPPTHGQPAIVLAPWLPSGQVLRAPLCRSVVLREPDLRGIAFSPDPRSALAALILQRSELAALCPYSYQGPVKDAKATLFFGRERELRELLAADSRFIVVVGPRRVGKSSLLLAAQRALRDEGRATRYLTLRNANSPGDLLSLLDPAPSADENDPIEAIHSLLSGELSDTTLLLDEVDALMYSDAGNRHPLAKTFRSLAQEGKGRLVLAGYWDLYRLGLDYDSPFYNLGRRVVLGPLGRADATNLAREPMQAAGYSWADSTLLEELVDRTGGYPSLVQLCCGNLMMGVRGQRSPELNRHDLDTLWSHSELQDYVIHLFDLNLDIHSQVVLLAFCHAQRFSRAEARQALIEHLALASVAKSRLDETLLRLQLYGALRRDGDVFYPCLPLLWETLSRLDREDRIQELRRGLPDGEE